MTAIIATVAALSVGFVAGAWWAALARANDVVEGCVDLLAEALLETIGQRDEAVAQRDAARASLRTVIEGEGRA